MSEVVGQQNHSRDWDGTFGAYRVNAATGKLMRIGTYATEKRSGRKPVSTGTPAIFFAMGVSLCRR
jgi:hypothetical protein